MSAGVTMSRLRCSSYVFAALGVLALPIEATAGAQDVSPQSSKSELVAGRRAFDANCARCHGIGGTGDTGPSLAQPSLPRARDDSLLRTLIRNGIGGTEMPGSFWLSEPDVRRIATYVRSLGVVTASSIAGNAAKGRAVYDDMGCESCHIVNGVGGVNGPELSSIGSRRSPAYLRRALLEPSADFPRERNYQLFALVNAIPRNGPAVLGVRVNEDTYTIQLRDRDGGLHSYRKTELKSLERRFSSSPMSSVRDKVSDAALNDLVAYLAGLRAMP
jgi:putative heme-binding domain-containing protein